MNMKLLDDNHVEMGDQINHISRPNDHEQCRKYPESILLATAIDRLCFIIYTVTFVAILISSFSG